LPATSQFGERSDKALDLWEMGLEHGFPQLAVRLGIAVCRIIVGVDPIS